MPTGGVRVLGTEVLYGKAGAGTANMLEREKEKREIERVRERGRER